MFGSTGGANRVFSLYVPEGGTERLFGHTKTFPALTGAPSFYAMSLRNKAFLTGTGAVASLRYSTTEAIRWQQTLPFTVAQALMGGKYSSLLFLDTTNRLHVYKLDDPHPESGMHALFGKVWYEGVAQPAYVWQSTGGTDDVEPKLSLHPPGYRQSQGDGLCHAVCRPHRLAGGDLHVTVFRPKLACPHEADHGNHGIAAFRDSRISGRPVVGTTARNACALVLTHAGVYTSRSLPVWQCLEDAADGVSHMDQAGL